MLTETHGVLDDNVTLTKGAANHESTVWKIPKRSIVWWEREPAVMIKITNGATHPTVAAKAQIQVSQDDSNYFNFGGALTGNTDNNGVESWVVGGIPKGARYLKVVSGSNTVQDVTIPVDAICGI
jgi:hypothetical protein